MWVSLSLSLCHCSWLCPVSSTASVCLCAAIQTLVLFDKSFCSRCNRQYGDPREGGSHNHIVFHSFFLLARYVLHSALFSVADRFANDPFNFILCCQNGQTSNRNTLGVAWMRRSKAAAFELAWISAYFLFLSFVAFYIIFIVAHFFIIIYL